MHRRRTGALALLAALLVLPLAACAGIGAPSGEASDAGIELAPDSAVPSTSDSVSERGLTESGPVGPDAGSDIISSGEMTLTVTDPATAVAEVREVTIDLGGYVESQNLSESTRDRPAEALLTVRVPSERFDDAFAELSAVGEVVRESRSAIDVSLQAADLRARVAALQESVDRLTELIAQSATTGELIEAESALAQRQQDLDGLRAQLRALDNQVDYASIWVYLTVDQVVPGGPTDFWGGLVAGFEALGAAAAAALVFFGMVLPWTLLAGLLTLLVLGIVALARRGGRARRSGSKTPNGSPPGD